MGTHVGRSLTQACIFALHVRLLDFSCKPQESSAFPANGQRVPRFRKSRVYLKYSNSNHGSPDLDSISVKYPCRLSSTFLSCPEQSKVINDSTSSSHLCPC